MMYTLPLSVPKFVKCNARANTSAPDCHANVGQQFLAAEQAIIDAPLTHARHHEWPIYLADSVRVNI